MELSRGVTRRALLRGAAAVAAAAAIPACAARRAAITGAIVGRTETRGHLLRTPGSATARVSASATAGATTDAPARTERADVVVAGAGVAGLSAAWKLARSGVTDLVVLELDDAPGGTSQSGENAVSPHPWGAHYVPVPTQEQRALCELLAEAGAIRGFDASGRAIPVERHLCRAPQERVFRYGHWSEGLWFVEGASDEDVRQFRAFHDATAALAARRDAEGRRAFAVPVVRSSRAADLLALDTISMAAWMDARGFDSPRLRWYVEYACRDDFGCTLATASAWAALHYFCARVAVPGDDAAEFLTWPEGNGFLVRRLAAAAEGRVRTGAVVSRIEPRADGAAVSYVDVASGERREIVARRVVCALPRFVARRVVAGLEAEPPAFTYAPWVVANLTLRSRPRSRGFPECWDNVLAESDSLGYVVATHQSDRPGHDTVWTWYRPFCGADPAADRERVLAATWEDWRDEVLADLVRAHPDLADHVVSIDVRRWGHGMVRPTPGFLWGGAREAAALPRGPVHFAGADLGGLALFEEAQWSGVRAAEEILAAFGRPFESSL